MKKKILLFSFLSCFVIFTRAQVLVDTGLHKRNVLIEEFTGVQCNSCPHGHQEIENLLAKYPGRIFAAGMHSFSTGHTEPYPGEQDLRRNFPDLLRPKTDLSGIPAGILNRRIFNDKECYIFWDMPGFQEKIDTAVNILLGEFSPFNIGLEAVYDTVNEKLRVGCRVYTTFDTVGIYRLNVYFTESNILVSQLNGSTVIPNYNEKHVFREILTSTWGSDLSTTGVKKGDTFYAGYIFINDSGYKMQNVQVIAFITNHTATTNQAGFVEQAFGIPVTLTGGLGVKENLSEPGRVSIYPNPADGDINIRFENPVTDELILTDLNGKTIFKREICNMQQIKINYPLPPGVYILRIKNIPGYSGKIIIAH